MTREGPRVSIIVPIYKVEPYIHKCIDSILTQSYSALEVILVDDGSPDECPRICDEYKEKDPRVKVVHKPNGGLSDARNAGLDVATGEYVIFIDGDDWIQKDVVEVLTRSAAQDTIVCIDAACVTDDEFIAERGTGTSNNLSSYEFLQGINERKYLCSSCGKLFPRLLVQDFRFEVGKLNEDYLFLSTLLMDKNICMQMIDYKGYNYLMRQGSISRSGLGKSSIDAVYNTVRIKEQAKVKCHSLVPVIGAYAAYQARTALLLMNSRYYRENKSFVEDCVHAIKDNIIYLDESFMEKKDILFCRLCVLSPFITVILGRKFHELRCAFLRNKTT